MVRFVVCNSAIAFFFYVTILPILPNCSPVSLLVFVGVLWEGDVSPGRI